MIGCASSHAEPPDQKPTSPASTNALATAVAPEGSPVDGLIIYGGNHADTNWTQLAVIPCTNLEYMAVIVPRYDEYKATSTNSQTGQSSPYSPTVYFPTNSSIPATPSLSIQPK